MLLEVIVAAVLLGALAGGKLPRLNELELRGSGFIFAALFTQLALPAAAKFDPSLPPYLLILSFLLLLIGLSRNRMTPAIILMIIGVFLNFAVISANRGMPVKAALPARGADQLHVRMTETTYLPWLADVIPWPLPGPLGGLVSLGDLFLSVGVFLLIFNGMMYTGKRRLKRKT